MNEISIKKEDFSHIVKKSDVWIVYTLNDKHWVCKPNSFKEDGIFITLTLATKGKCDR